MAVWRCGVLLRRLHGKTRLAALKTKAKKKQSSTCRAVAVKDGLIPKARRAFALFVKDSAKKLSGSARDDCRQEMQRMGKAWRALPAAEKAKYHKQSAAEFEVQRQALMSRGLPCRSSVHAKQKSTVQSPKPAGGPCSAKPIHLGPFVVEQENGSSVLGTGTYGKVFRAMCANGRLCAVKVFSGRCAKEAAAFEVSVYQQLDKLGHAERAWFPAFIQADRNAQPWPWMAVSFGHRCLSKHLKEHGPLQGEVLRSMALQLQAALKILHEQAQLLHLDVKPGNILWFDQTACLQLCDFGMVEPVAMYRPKVHKCADYAMLSPRFNEYVAAWYRPPELWSIDDGSAVSLRKALTPAVDIWSYGCTIYEAGVCEPLMKPQSRRNYCPRQSITNWCKVWPELVSQSKLPALHPARAHILFQARLGQLSSYLRSVVMTSCCPQPCSRKWGLSPQSTVVSGKVCSDRLQH